MKPLVLELNSALWFVSIVIFYDIFLDKINIYIDMIYLCKLNMYMQIENYRLNMGRNTSYTYDNYLEYTEYIIYVSFVHV